MSAKNWILEQNNVPHSFKHRALNNCQLSAGGASCLTSFVTEPILAGGQKQRVLAGANQHAGTTSVDSPSSTDDRKTTTANGLWGWKMYTKLSAVNNFCLLLSSGYTERFTRKKAWLKFCHAKTNCSRRDQPETANSISSDKLEKSEGMHLVPLCRTDRHEEYKYNCLADKWIKITTHGIFLGSYN